MQQSIRQPVVVVLGHVDSGKTSLLDKIRGTAVQAREVGGMTQHIGASFFPAETLKQICGPLISRLQAEVSVPGLLVIDTPGHEVFSNLRSRGGSAADLSILVVDVQRGFEVQTFESVDILRRRKVPFVVALNKLDMIPGWRRQGMFLSESIRQQPASVTEVLDNKIYTVLGELSRLGFQSEFIGRVKDFTKEIAIVPVSAKTGEGIPELLAVLIGLAQQHLRRKLVVSGGVARGIVLELKEEPGLGPTANVILLDGVLNVGEMVALTKREGPVLAKVRGIFLPKPLDEMRDPRDRFTSVDRVTAAAGVKIIASDIDDVLAGSPFLSVPEEGDQEAALREVAGDVESVFIESDAIGVVVKADALGSLEALTDILRKSSVSIRIGDVGRVSRRDVVEADMVRGKDRFRGVILSFGVKILPDAEEYLKNAGVKVFSDPNIFNLVSSYLSWVREEKESEARMELASIKLPSKFRFLKGYVFRRSDPAVFGVEVMSGKVKQNAHVVNVEGEVVGTIHGLQDQGKSINEASAGAQVAVSMTEPVVGRHISEGEILYTLPSSEEAKVLQRRFGDRLSELGLDVLIEVIEVRRKKVPEYAF